MKKLFTLLAAFSSFAMFAAPAIVLEENAPVYENTAAKELMHYLYKICPAEGIAKIVAEAPAPAIHVGQSPAALKAFGLSGWDALKPDEVIYQVDDEGNLWIAGQGKRGTLYAVYECLEREYGVRFFADDDEKIPGMEKFALPAKGTKYRFAPPFMVRALYYQQVLYGKDPAFHVKMRHTYGGDDALEWGGLDEIIGGVHTFDGMLIPSAKYFDAHPEWFAFRDGARRSGGQSTQLCLTNKEMRKELIKNALEKCAENPSCRFISVSQNDNFNYCLCDQCQAFVKEHGNQSDLLIDCVNEVADAVAEKYPDVYVDTLAYQYTRQVPGSVRPHKNVVIRYCTIEARQLFPLHSPQNQDLYDELQTWKKVAPQMLIWNYVTSFANYAVIHPNWANIAPDLRLFRECHAINVLEQGSWNHGGKAADLTDLRIYLVGKLTWNPDLDPQALIHEFCDHYYGPGAPYIYDYINAVTAMAARHPECKDNCFHTTVDGFMSPEELADLWKNLYGGARKYQMDIRYGSRMAIAALPVTMALLEHPALFNQPQEKRPAALRDVDPNALLAWCCNVIPLAKLDALMEGGYMIQEWVNKMQALYVPEAPESTK